MKKVKENWTMRRYFKREPYIILIALISFYLYGANALAKEQDSSKNRLTPQSPRYELKLNPDELSVFNSGVVEGLNKYGGGAEFSLRMVKEGNKVVRTVTITNPKLIEVLRLWLAEKLAKLIDSVDINNLDDSSKHSLATMKSLNRKVAHAKENPIWDPVTLSGLVVEEKGVLFIEGEQGKYRATGNYLKELKKRKGKRVIANGYVKVRNQIEVVAFLEKKENTLELFVMSMCPFARMAEASVIHYLETYSGKPKPPSLEIRYIFYRKENKDGKVVFTSMHGEEEIKENLVQMVIRDECSKFYYDYLLKRADDSDSPWDKLAKRIGMRDKDIDFIKRKIQRDRQTLIQKEYDYVTGTYRIYDGSPSYVWESERVPDIQQVEAFRDMRASSDKCSE